ncbi:MAG: hypothetical protein KIT31_13865 [Deltaproteobacteria bacterium]|nr:hypothetical protein [Deltaproteobacteria bacterium]
MAIISNNRVHGLVDVTPPSQHPGTVAPPAQGVLNVGDYWHLTPRVRLLGPAEWRDFAAVHTADHRQVVLAASSSALYMPLSFLRVGDLVTKMRVRCHKGTGSGSTVTARLQDFVDGTASTLATATENGASTGSTSVVTGDIEILIRGGRTYAVQLTPSGSVSPAADRLYGLEISYCRPHWKWLDGSVGATGPIT